MLDDEMFDTCPSCGLSKNLPHVVNGLRKKKEQAEREREELKKQLALYRNMSSYPRDDDYCGHHFVDNRCTICGKVVKQNIFDVIGG